MSRLWWFRLPHGRVWHLSIAPALSRGLCGELAPASLAEEQPERPPLGGRPCPRCADVAEEAQLSVWSARWAMVTSDAEVVEAEEGRCPSDPDDDGPTLPDVLGQDGEVGLVGAQPYEVDEGPLCACGHPEADHDVDEPRRCWVQIDDPDDDRGECDCQQLRVEVA